MKFNRFQLNLTEIPNGLRPTILEKVKEVLEKNGFNKKSLSVVLVQNISYLVLGQSSGSISWYYQPYSHKDYENVIVYDVITEWDKWTAIKAVNDFEPIVLDLDPVTKAVINETFIDVNGAIMNFAKFDRIADAVKKARDWNKKP